MDTIRRMKMWNWIKEFIFGVEAKVETAVKAEVEVVKTKAKKVKEKLDVNKDGNVNVEDVKEAVKKVTRKKK